MSSSSPSNWARPTGSTVFGVWLDVAVVAAFTLWIATLSTVTCCRWHSARFAIGGRALGAVFDYVAKGADGQVDLAARYGPLLDLVRWVLPDLSRLDWRAGRCTACCRISRRRDWRC
jgi:Cu-processing system permease protein